MIKKYKNFLDIIHIRGPENKSTNRALRLYRTTLEMFRSLDTKYFCHKGDDDFKIPDIIKKV